jgi:hypothetical protein
MGSSGFFFIIVVSGGGVEALYRLLTEDLTAARLEGATKA